MVPAYEEGGEAIGRAIMYDPGKEPYYWSLVGGTGIWPRWYLKCFATLYRQAHRREYEGWKKSRQYRDKMRHTREQAVLETNLIAHQELNPKGNRNT